MFGWPVIAPAWLVFALHWFVLPVFDWSLMAVPEPSAFVVPGRSVSAVNAVPGPFVSLESAGLGQLGSVVLA